MVTVTNKHEKEKVNNVKLKRGKKKVNLEEREMTCESRSMNWSLKRDENVIKQVNRPLL